MSLKVRHPCECAEREKDLAEQVSMIQASQRCFLCLSYLFLSSDGESRCSLPNVSLYMEHTFIV